MDFDIENKTCSFCGVRGTQGAKFAGGLGAMMCVACVEHFHDVFSTAAKTAAVNHPPWEKMSDSEILGNRRQLDASLRLTLWLAQRFHVRLSNIIGHNESLTSPYHHELYPTWRCMTHADFPHWAMHQYRQRLRTLATKRGIAVGPPPAWVDNGC